jgi:hypothetical protein
LTTEQRNKVDATCDSVYALGLSTEPIDQARCRAAVARAYEARSLEAPPVEFYASPAAATARLLACAPEGAPTAPAPTGDVAAVLRGDFSSVWNMIASAQPQSWPALGEEVDVSFHAEAQQHYEELTWRPEVGRTVWRRVDSSKVADIVHVAHAADDGIEDQLAGESTSWLRYTAAKNTFWKEAVEYAAFECAIALGAAAVAPPRVAAGRELLESCSWLYSFEKLCLVCDRPLSVDVQKGDRQVSARVAWRDGTRAEHHWKEE